MGLKFVETHAWSVDGVGKPHVSTHNLVTEHVFRDAFPGKGSVGLISPMMLSGMPLYTPAVL